jgi:hypothetical protein
VQKFSHVVESSSVGRITNIFRRKRNAISTAIKETQSGRRHRWRPDQNRLNTGRDLHRSCLEHLSDTLRRYSQLALGHFWASQTTGCATCPRVLFEVLTSDYRLATNASQPKHQHQSAQQLDRRERFRHVGKYSYDLTGVIDTRQFCIVGV